VGKLNCNVIRKPSHKLGSLLVFFLLLIVATPNIAKIFYSKNEAMALAFGENATIETLSLFPDDQQTQKIQELAKTKLESGLFTFYVGKSGGKVLGYAAIESVTVRTKPETLLIVLSPEGELKQIVTLAFHEPPEYQPPENWFEQLYKRPLADMDFNKGIQGISGATLSTRANVNSTRKVLAIFEIMLKNQKQN
jgi:hypothetical protein